MRDEAAWLIALCLIATTLPLTQTASGQTKDVDLVPRCTIDTGARMVHCDVRLNTKVPDNFLIQEEKGFSDVKITWPDKQAQTLPLSRFGQDNENAAWLILIDQSKSLSASTIAAIKRDFGRVILKKRSNDLIGVGTFDRNYRLLATVGSPQSLLEQKLGEIKPVGDQTYLYQSVEAAIGALKDTDADRKALVIVTDGLAEDPNADAARFSAIRTANENDVVIYSVTYAQGQPDASVFANMKELAERTGGPSRQANLKQGPVLSDTYSDRFYEFLKNGGSISFPLRTLEKDGSVKFGLSTTVYGVSGLVDVDADVRLAHDGIQATGFFQSILDSFQKVFGKSGGLAVLIALVTVILALLGLAIYALFFRPKRQPAPAYFGGAALADGGALAPADGLGMAGGIYGQGVEPLDGDAATSILPPRNGSASEVYGWLEVVGSGDRIPLKQTGLRIGRHEDNDIRFDATTVHRRHAVVHMTPQRDFVITDLSGANGNGVQINSVRVERAELRDGDLVQLGEVRVKFHAATI